MKKHLFTFLAVAFCATAHADLLLVEDFDYTAGTPLSNCGWVTTYGDTSVTAVSNGLSFDGYAGCGIGNGAIIGEGKDSSSQPHKSFEAQTEGDIYVAFMLQPYMTAKASYFFCLRDAISTSVFNYNARIFLNEANQIGLSYCDGVDGAQFADRVLDNATTYLVVLKYTIVAGAKNDQVSLYLLDAFTANEPAEPLLTTTNSSSSANADINPQNIVLRSSGSDDWILVDGIRVATTWAEAVAAGSCPSTGMAQPQSDALHLYTENGSILGADHMQIFNITGVDVTNQNGSLHGIYLVKTAGRMQKVVVK